MEKEFVDLFNLQSMIREGMERLFPKRVWLRAEISSIKARNGGHCYMELSQSDDSGLIAKANAVIWSSKYRFIAPYFESVTGSPLMEGMVIMAEVQVNYSQLYGLSLIINDIDAEFSLGLKEMERQKTIERLKSEGLIDLQQTLSLACLPYDLAVISAEDAAGYRDFIRHLQENPYGFEVSAELYPALMQGADSPRSVIEALDAVLESGKHYDAVLVLRGGGARLDLACFDDYELAAVIAQYPLPVLTAIGHDQDYHVCDMVAHTFVKTPTALADFILGFFEDEDAVLTTLQSRIRLAAAGRVSSAESSVSLLWTKMKGALALRLSSMEADLKLLETRIWAADPRRVIERGYALAVDGQGVVIKGAAGRCIGDSVSLVFHDGRLDCTVDKVKILSEE